MISGLDLDRTVRGGIQTRSTYNARLLLKDYKMDIKFGLERGVDMISIWSEYEEMWLHWTRVNKETIIGLQETIHEGEGVRMTKKSIREAVTKLARWRNLD